MQELFSRGKHLHAWQRYGRSSAPARQNRWVSQRQGHGLRLTPQRPRLADTGRLGACCASRSCAGTLACASPAGAPGSSQQLAPSITSRPRQNGGLMIRETSKRSAPRVTLRRRPPRRVGIDSSPAPARFGSSTRRARGQRQGRAGRPMR